MKRGFYAAPPSGLDARCVDGAVGKAISVEQKEPAKRSKGGCGHTPQDHEELLADPKKWAALPFAYFWSHKRKKYETRFCRDPKERIPSTLSLPVSR